MAIILLPGTTIEARLGTDFSPSYIFEPMFLLGPLVLSQLSSLSGLEPHVIQNWVKRGFVSRPIGKKYSKNQVFRIFIINILKSVIRIEQIARLLDNSPKDEYELYCDFIEVLKADAQQPPGDGLLRIMLLAYESTRLKAEAENVLNALISNIP